MGQHNRINLIILCVLQALGEGLSSKYPLIASLQWGKPPPQKKKNCPESNTKQSDAGALGNVEYLFIAIAPRSTLAQSGST